MYVMSKCVWIVLRRQRRSLKDTNRIMQANNNIRPITIISLLLVSACCIVLRNRRAIKTGCNIPTPYFVHSSTDWSVKAHRVAFFMHRYRQTLLSTMSQNFTFLLKAWWVAYIDRFHRCNTYSSLCLHGRISRRIYYIYKLLVNPPVYSILKFPCDKSADISCSNWIEQKRPWSEYRPHQKEE